MDVEYFDTDSSINVSDSAVEVEEYDTISYINVSDSAVMVEYIINTGHCGINDTGLVAYYEFASRLHCYMSRADEIGLSITGELTVGCWVFFTSRSMGWNTGIISKWYEAGGERSYVLYKNNINEIVFSVSSDGVTLSCSVNDSGINFDTDKWMYIVGRYTPSGEIALFISGNWYTNTTGVPASLHDGSEPFEIARYSRNNYLDGGMCHLFVSADALTNAEIEAMYSHTIAMFVASPDAIVTPPSGIAERMTNAGVMIEYQAVNKLRMTNAGIMIEYGVPTYLYMTNSAVEIEYEPLNKLRMTNAGIMIEYEPLNKLRMTNAGIMIEYEPSSSSSSSSSTSSSSSSSSTTTSSSSAPP